MRNSRQPCVYILASGRHGTLYVGVTSDLASRVHQHREGRIAGFTRRFGIKRLVHFEMFDTMEAAIQREKAMKKWNRAWKLALIEERNPIGRILRYGCSVSSPAPPSSFPRKRESMETRRPI